VIEKHLYSPEGVLNVKVEPVRKLGTCRCKTVALLGSAIIVCVIIEKLLPVADRVANRIGRGNIPKYIMPDLELGAVGCNGNRKVKADRWTGMCRAGGAILVPVEVEGEQVAIAARV
jgi:hypothetical protein